MVIDMIVLSRCLCTAHAATKSSQHYPEVISTLDQIAVGDSDTMKVMQMLEDHIHLRLLTNLTKELTRTIMF